jgi:VanZ family protein
MVFPESCWNHWYRRALPAYWIFVLCGTHFPDLAVGEGAPPWTDKVLHLGVFAGLALFFWKFFETFRRPVSGRFVWHALVVLLSYAVLDEFTQRYVGRSSDVVDWLFGAGGIAAMLALLEWRRRVGLRRGSAPGPSGKRSAGRL